MSYIGQYQILGELGRGAMAVVWLGYDAALDRHVAIKELQPSTATSPAIADEIKNRFLLEARAVARLHHPGIVSIYAAGEFDGRAAIAMELLEGETLGATLSRGPIHPDSVAPIISQLLEAVFHAHSNGVIHRDIKPENVFILPTGRVKLTDFGIAHFADSAMTQIGTVIGTPGYMSPEQVLGQATDERSDLFSIGVVAYEMLSGANPFGSSPALPVPSIMYNIVHEQVADITQRASGVPRAMSSTLRALLAKSPDQRPRNAEHALRLWNGLERMPTTGLFGMGAFGRRPSTGQTTVPAPPIPSVGGHPAATVIEHNIAAGAVVATVIEPAVLAQNLDPSPFTSGETGGLTGADHESHELPAGATGAPPRAGFTIAVAVGIAAVVGLAIWLAPTLIDVPPAQGGGDTTRTAATSQSAGTTVSASTTATIAATGKAAAGSSPVAATNTKVTLKPSTIKRGSKKKSTITITVRAGGRHATGSVVVYKKKNGSKKWTRVKSVRLKNGKATLQVTPTKTTRYYASYKGSGDFKASKSKSKNLIVTQPVVSGGGSGGGGSSGGGNGGGPPPAF